MNLREILVLCIYLLIINTDGGVFKFFLKPVPDFLSPRIRYSRIGDYYSCVSFYIIIIIITYSNRA